MSDDPVERLARVLYEAKTAPMGGRGIWAWECRAPEAQEEWRKTARYALAAGVTLSAPVAPRLTPLQAAADALSVRAEAFGRMLTDAECEAYARAVLAAAVGALTNAKDSVTEREDHVIIDNSWILRAVLLAALTEGGEG